MSETTIEDVIHAALKYRRLSLDKGDDGIISHNGVRTTLGDAQDELFQAIDRLPDSGKQLTRWQERIRA